MYLNGISLKARIRREGEISKNSWHVKTTSRLQKVIIKKKTMFKAMSVAYRRHVWGDLLFNSARTHLIHLGR